MTYKKKEHKHIKVRATEKRLENATVMALSMGGYLSSANQTSRRPRRGRKVRHSKI